ncbi:MAG: PA14 domain-containing protein [Brevinematales bacterium]|nr:PA14 domain-containing protein [Brevinematales bacterium]
MKIDRRHLVLSFFILFGLYFLIKLIGPYFYIVQTENFITPIFKFNKPIKMTILKQNGTIETLDTPKNIDFENNFYIKTINFPQNMELKHKNFGKLGFSGNFFITFKTKIYVKQEAYYVFEIISDDGFRLKLNNQTAGELTSNRPFSSSEIFIHLKKGTYNLELEYFQGYGPCGIIAYYRNSDKTKKYLLGKNSRYFTFKTPD